MPRLIIGNVDSEYMNAAPERLDWATLCTDSAVANRLAWYMTDHCALVTPSPAAPAFLDYVAQFTGVDADTVTVISPTNSPASTPELITRRTLFDTPMSSKIMDWANNVDGEVEVLAYLYDPNVSRLTTELGVRSADDTAFILHGGAVELNKKTVFKRTAELLGIPQPKGASVDTRQQMTRAIANLITRTGRVIVKMDSAAGGDGNTLVYVSGRACPGIGTSRQVEVASASRDECIDDAVATILSHEGDVLGVSHVVEEYHAHSESYYSEFYVPTDRRSPQLLNHGRMRMEPVWNGFEIPSTRMTQVQAAQFASYSTSLAHYAQTMGYAGMLNVDGLVTEHGQVLVNEFNGRYGGCSHIDHISRRLYGDSYALGVTVVSKNHVPTNFSFHDLVHALDVRGLLWSQDTKTGCIIATEDTQRTKTFEYVVYAPDLEAAKRLEDAVTAAAKP